MRPLPAPGALDRRGTARRSVRAGLRSLVDGHRPPPPHLRLHRRGAPLRAALPRSGGGRSRPVGRVRGVAAGGGGLRSGPWGAGPSGFRPARRRCGRARRAPRPDSVARPRPPAGRRVRGESLSESPRKRASAPSSPRAAPIPAAKRAARGGPRDPAAAAGRTGAVLGASMARGPRGAPAPCPSDDRAGAPPPGSRMGHGGADIGCGRTPHAAMPATRARHACPVTEDVRRASAPRANSTTSGPRAWENMGRSAPVGPKPHLRSTRWDAAWSSAVYEKRRVGGKSGDGLRCRVPSAAGRSSGPRSAA